MEQGQRSLLLIFQADSWGQSVPEPGYKNLGRPSSRRQTGHSYPKSYARNELDRLAGPLDTDLLIQHVEQLLNYQAIEKPVYDYVAHTRSTETVIQEPKEVIILEGILILEDRRLRDLMDIKVYVDTDDDIRIIRRIKRDMEERGRTLDSVIEQYLTVVKPMYHQFIEPTKRYADIIVPEGGENHVAIDLINTKVDSILTKM